MKKKERKKNTQHVNIHAGSKSDQSSRKTDVSTISGKKEVTKALAFF